MQTGQRVRHLSGAGPPGRFCLLCPGSRLEGGWCPEEGAWGTTLVDLIIQQADG